MSTLSHLAPRIIFVAGAIGLWFWTQRLISAKAPVKNGVGDRLHDWSAPLHAWFLARPRATNLTLILTSLGIDLFGLYLFARSIFGPTLQPLVAIFVLFSLRLTCQALCTLPIPPGAIWHHPGFPSLFVTYGTSNDFFFSGHTALSVLGAMYLAHDAPPWLAAIGAAIAVAEAITVIILRAHYTMDVFAAPFAAWGAEEIARRSAPYLDAWLARFG
jgi:hypothetical protein